MNPGDRVWNAEHRQLCQLIETQKLWGEIVCRVWLPAQGTVTSLSAARVLVSTDAGGEGLNLQFCYIVINYDIPWNPMRLEQRIGRVDRIGQRHTVRAANFVLEDTVAFRVRQVLEEKLAIILAEFGVDKTSDVLDSVQAGELFDELFAMSLIDPVNVEARVETMMSQVHEQAREAAAAASMLGTDEELSIEEAQRVTAHHMPLRVERMTVNYLKSHDGAAEKRGSTWALRWPSGEESGEVVFALRDADDSPGAHHLTLEEERAWRSQLERKHIFSPDMSALILARIEADSF